MSRCELSSAEQRDNCFPCPAGPCWSSAGCHHLIWEENSYSYAIPGSPAVSRQALSSGEMPTLVICSAELTTPTQPERTHKTKGQT